MDVATIFVIYIVVAYTIAFCLGYWMGKRDEEVRRIRELQRQIFGDDYKEELKIKYTHALVGKDSKAYDVFSRAKYPKQSFPYGNTPNK